MGALDQPIIKSQGYPLPQFFNAEGNYYQEQTGRDGAAWYHQRGTVTIDYITSNANFTKSYSNKCYGFSIVNDGTGDITAVINGLTITVKEGESFDSLFKPFTSIAINSTNTPFRAVIKE
ncbi:hypothetical protein [Psychrobacillus sp. BM2]|uniref:hypothetical protein n=1 Tax=Psychrobacillus sp. BM2 TaxID=3400421 RepID=UPI003B02D0BA